MFESSRHKVFVVNRWNKKGFFINTGGLKDDSASRVRVPGGLEHDSASKVLVPGELVW